MDFRISESFMVALARLQTAEQKATNDSAFRMLSNPTAHGLRMHRVDTSSDPNFWSARVNDDIRMIVHRMQASLLLAYVDHHDKAYRWAERRRIEAHPRTGAIQIVVIPERVDELRHFATASKEAMPQSEPPLFAHLTNDALLAVGVPEDWLPFVQNATETTFLEIAPHLPSEAAEALLEAATSGRLSPPPSQLVAQELPEAMALPVAQQAYPEVPRALPDIPSAYVAPRHPLAPPPSRDPEAAEPIETTGKPGAAKESGSEPSMHVILASIRRIIADDSAPSRLIEAATGAGFDHPDARRRFRKIDSADELAAALDAPWERWAVFLHPSQRAFVERDYDGPARVAGSAGTGKTVVALHRAVRLLRADPRARVLLTTFSQPLADALRRKIDVLAGPDATLVPRLTVAPFGAIAGELYEATFGHRPRLANEAQLRAALAKSGEGQSFSARFLFAEWTQVFDAWQVTDAAGYAAVPRLGRRNRLGAKQRERLAAIFLAARDDLRRKHLMTPADVFGAVAAHFASRAEKPFAHVVVDEAQDLGVPELRFLAAIVPATANALFFAGDLGQRIFQQPFSWKGLGIDLRGRAPTLKVNYRTSHQIRQAADRLLPPTMRDVDNREEERKGTISVFDGPLPEVARCANTPAERDRVAAFLRSVGAAGVAPHEIGVFVRSRDEIARAHAAVETAGLAFADFTDRATATGGKVGVRLMHLAKGLEFKAVVVMACDADVLPLKARMDAVIDEADLDEVFETERQLLYVACTRARDHLLVSGVVPCSDYLQDLCSTSGETS